MSSISQMERSSSQTRMLATRPPFCGGGCELHRRGYGQGGCGEVFRRSGDTDRLPFCVGLSCVGLSCVEPSCIEPFCIEPFCVKASQPEDESCSLPRPRAGPHFAFVGLHDLVDHDQAEPSAAFKV